MPLNWHEHETAGRQLREIRDQLLTLAVDLSKAYKKRGKPAAIAKRALSAVDALRVELDDRVHQEHPDNEEADRLYYGSVGS